MFTRGEFTTNNVTYGAIMSHTKAHTEVILITSGTIVSAYKVDDTGSYSFNNVRAKELAQMVLAGVKSCTSKNGTPQPFELGAMTSHEFVKSKVEYTIQLYRGEVVGAFIQSADKRLEMEYIESFQMPTNIEYVKLTTIKKDLNIVDDDLDAIQTRSVQEIALEKDDITWLQRKKYFIVNDDETAEKLFSFFDQYNGPIAYDTETTGLKINCFGQINSKYQHDLIKYNKEHKDNPIRADKLVGIIFCVEEDTSYYFPCFNRKFKNLYDDLQSPIRNRIIQNTKALYTVGKYRESDTCIAEYWRNTPADEITSDCILMERVRNILETKHIVAHNGSFEYKVGLQYWIDTNLKDDTMILHQVAYKFRNGGGKAEPSNLKYLSKKELGIDQWELHDFFPNWKPDKDGLVRRKPGSKINNANQIDFSYMDYQGTRVYAPTDGDCTLGLFHKFKSDLLQNHKEMEYIYNVEVIVACAIGYMEFYGHRIDESKILHARSETMANKSQIISEIRQMIDYADEKELAAYKEIKEFRENQAQLKLKDDEFNEKLIELVGKLDAAIESNAEKQINLGSSAQVCDLFYNKLQIPCSEEKQSVAKKVIKALIKEKNDDGTPKYPVVHLYSKYKNEETLLSKFFDNLIYFTYPGGFIFSSFGQIATNTGRMSCSKPNCQQYPKVITKIIIPRDGYVMIDADYSQIEYRVLTAMAGNDWLAELFSNPDSDYHTLMASLMYGVDYSAVTSSMRSAAKSFNFGIPYGMGLGSLAILLTGKNTAQTRDEAAEKMDDYFKNQPKTKKFFANVKEMAQVNGYTKTLFNRYRYYSFTDKDGNVNNAKKAAALRQAGNAVIQGTAADIFKIGVARNFSFIRNNHLLGKMLIINMIHDEQLMEVDVQNLNMQRIVAEVGKNMQFKIDGFPPLYIGAGVGKAWGYAKGKQAEIHPTLLQQFTEEAKDIPIWRTEEQRKEEPYVDPSKVLKYFDDRVVEFRRQKVADYLSNPENWHKTIYPAISGLINLQFNYGRGDDAKAYVGPNGETYSDQEFLELNIADFLKENNINADASWFRATDNKAEDEEEDKEYSEGDEDDDDIMDMVEGDADVKAFTIVDESDKTFGSTIHDMINVFGTCLLKQQRVCGINTKNMYYKRKDALIDYLMKYLCDEDDPDGYQIVFLTDANILKYTGIYVKNLNSDKLEEAYKNANGRESDYTQGDVKTRSQAK
jgi:DNA polymerase I-like protein with 3'-5' exonuclease and polymerase domains